jgi:predicted SAM-dependent methyltransferase
MDIYPKIVAPSFKNLLKFELTSWIGRHFHKKRSRFKLPKDNKPFLVDIAAGQNYTEGWTHVDFYRSPFRFRSRLRKRKRKPEVETDLRFPLLCSDNCVDGIFSSHTLEHLYPNHGWQLLSEMYRILKPGKWLRIIVPDLKIAIDYYNGQATNIEMEKRYKYKAEAICRVTQGAGHHSGYDEELLTVALKAQGFINIRKVEFGIEGTDKRLIKEENVRKPYSLVLEAQKP